MKCVCVFVQMSLQEGFKQVLGHDVKSLESKLFALQKRAIRIESKPNCIISTIAVIIVIMYCQCFIFNSVCCCIMNTLFVCFALQLATCVRLARRLLLVRYQF